MFKSFWIFGYNPSPIQTYQLITTIIDLGLGSYQNWHRFAQFKNFALYTKGSKTYDKNKKVGA